MYLQKFCLPPPSSDFLADIIGLQKKQIIGDLPKEMEGMTISNLSRKAIVCVCVCFKEKMGKYQGGLDSKKHNQGSCLRNHLVRLDS